jgi:ABC-type branched-subunit amino acid transport system substrate-binding protein
MAKKELGDQGQMARLYALASKKTDKKREKAKKKTAADMAAGRPPRIREDLAGDSMTNKTFTKKLTKKYGDWTDVLGTARSYTDKVADMRKKGRR